MNTKAFTVVIHREEEQYVAECLEVGTVDQGETIEIALSNLKEATRLYLEATNQTEFTPRFVTSIEVEVA